jgi:hypothetical protein
VYLECEASREIVVLIAKEENPHSIEETLVKPSILRAAKIALGESSEVDPTSVSTVSTSSS